jgi:hypothetical protein
VAGAHPVALRYTSLSTAEGFFSVLIAGCTEVEPSPSRAHQRLRSVSQRESRIADEHGSITVQSAVRHNDYYQLLCSALGALTALSLIENNHVTGIPGEGAGERVVAKNFVF